MNNWNIISRMEPMYVGEELEEQLLSVPDYDSSIMNASVSERLLALNDIYNLYLPLDMSFEIYTQLYLALMRSFQKKESRLAQDQRILNAANIRNGASIVPGGIIGGADSFSIIGKSGIGKSSAIERAIQILKGYKVIELTNPYCKILPVVNVQCPFDCSPRTLLLSVCQQIDQKLGTDYYDMLIKSRAAVNLMITSVSQILLNHCALLIIDEVQNLVYHKAGSQLVSMLTELLNISGISICLVGTPEVEPFFEGVDYLARRTVGLRYEQCGYNNYFKNFCMKLWEYQYTTNRSELNEGFINYLYQHSNGTLCHVVYLFKTAQEIAILAGDESIDIGTLEQAYQRMRMLHSHIQSAPFNNSIQKRTASKKITKRSKNTNEHSISAENNWNFAELASKAKASGADIVEILREYTNVEVVG